MVTPVTDPDILAQLNAPDESASPSPVTDPELLKQLNASDSPNLQGDTPNGDQGILPKAIDKSMNQIGSMRAMRPFGGLKDSLPIPTSATGDPIKDIIDSAQKILEYPTRLSQTMGALSGPADEATKTYFDSIGFHPAISWLLGKAAGMASDPRNIAMFGEGGVPNLKGEDFPALNPFGGAETEARVAKAEAQGITLSPEEATQSKFLKISEDLGNIYPYTGDQFQNFYKSRMSEVDAVRARLQSVVGENKATEEISKMMKSEINTLLQDATPEDAAYLQDRFGNLDVYMKKKAAGQFSQSMLAQSRKIASDTAGAEFEALKDVTPPETPNPYTRTAPMAKKFLKEELQAEPVDQNAQWVKRLGAYAGLDPTLPEPPPEFPGQKGAPTTEEWKNYQRLVAEASGKSGQDVAQGPSTFGKAQATMRKLRDLRIQNDPGYLLGIKGQGNTYAGYAAELRGALHDDMTDALNNLSKQSKQVLEKAPPSDQATLDHLTQMTSLSDRWDAAKANWAKMKEVTNDPFIIKILKNDPEDFLDHAITDKDITNVSKLKDLLGPDNFVPVQQNVLANMFVNKAGELDPHSFVTKFNKIGLPTLSTTFKSKAIAEIAKSQEVFGLMKRGFAEGSQTGGRLMAKAAIFGTAYEAFRMLMAGEPVAAIGSAVGTIGIPRALARFYLSDTGREMLIHGVAMPDAAAGSLSAIGKAAMMSSIENARASAVPQDQQGPTQ